MTAVAIHQPDFLPYLGFFAKMRRADVFILYDTAQYSKNGFHNRNRIKTPRGAAWLTIPVRSPGLQPIRAVQVDNSRQWGRRIWQTLEANYRRAAHFNEYARPIYETLTDRRWDSLVDLNRTLLDRTKAWLDVRTDTVLASDLPAPTTSNPTEKLVQLTRSVGGEVYLSGPGSGGYLDPSRFRDVSLEVVEPKEISYDQLWGEFIPRLSVLDALLNCGVQTRALI